MELYLVNERPAPDVLSQPEVQLHHWRILRRGNGTLHIAAQLDSGSLRVTSLLQAIDLPRTIVKTESGRSYHLCNPPEEDQLLRSLIVLNAARGLVHVSGDVSDAIWAAITTGAGPMKAPACCLQCNSSAQAVWTVDLMPWGSSSPLISTMQEIPDGPAFHPTDFICCSQKGADTPLG